MLNFHDELHNCKQLPRVSGGIIKYSCYIYSRTDQNALMQRRNFIKKSIAIPAATLIPASALISMTEAEPFTTTKAILPKRLQPGATLGLIAPGYAVSTEKLEEAIGYIKDLGYQPYHTHRITGNHGYLSNTDEERLADLHHMFENKEVDGILCIRGGYGCTRILPKINWELIKNNPKVFAGFSDITALLNTMQQKTGLVCFHAPVGTTLDTDYNREQFQKVINGKGKNTTLTPYPYHQEEKNYGAEFTPYTICEGEATGILTGGNLSLLAAMTGTPFEPDYTDKIVFIEEIEEEPYRIDRMLTQLRQSASFNRAKAIVLGIFNGCNTARNPESFSLKEVLTDRLADMNIPIAYGLPIGHIDENATLPLGVPVTVDASKITVKILTNSVI